MTPGHRLTLLRHAKSSWEDRTLRDHARPLASRGVTDAAALRRRLLADGFTVSLVLCSTARRTRETWDGVSGGVSGDPRVVFADAVYEASAPDLLALVRGLDEDVSDVLLIGHNPGIGELAFELTGDGEPTALHRLAEKFPTAAFAALSVPAAWAGLDARCARLEQFVRPRDLPTA